MPRLEAKTIPELFWTAVTFSLRQGGYEWYSLKKGSDVILTRSPSGRTSKMIDTPFQPAESALTTILRIKFISRVTRWLLGKEEMSVLAQASESSWETALTILVLIDAAKIFTDQNEEQELCKTIKVKTPSAAKWLMSKQQTDSNGLIYWEGVTWDTAVIAYSIHLIAQTYPDEFSPNDRLRIKTATKQACKWLKIRFSGWETEVKYPFGPADVARIAVLFMQLSESDPELITELKTEFGTTDWNKEWILPIIEYLLHRKTEQTLTVTINETKEDILTYWWDDYFSTSEVVDCLARYYRYLSRMDDENEQTDQLLKSLLTALFKACTYFEHSQVNGMWGSHVDTIKVIHAYVGIRSILPSGKTPPETPIFTPEIHTTFKALRWMCDEKQIFSDGSFLHTMFLTIFYAQAIINVYQAWGPAAYEVGKIYDDVLWSSPVRSTPERIKRLSAEIQIAELNKKLAEERNENLVNATRRDELARTIRRINATIAAVIFCIIVYFSLAKLFGLVDFSMKALNSANDVIAYTALSATVLIALLTAAWKRK